MQETLAAYAILVALVAGLGLYVRQVIATAQAMRHEVPRLPTVQPERIARAKANARLFGALVAAAVIVVCLLNILSGWMVLLIAAVIVLGLLV